MNIFAINLLILFLLALLLILFVSEEAGHGPGARIGLPM